jgi:hypothetical protein
MKFVAFVRFCFSAICFVVISHFAAAQITTFTAKQGVAAVSQAVLDSGFADARLVAIYINGTADEGYGDWNGKAHDWNYVFMNADSLARTFTATLNNQNFTITAESEWYKQESFYPEIGENWMDSDSLAKIMAFNRADDSAFVALYFNLDTSINRLVWEWEDKEDMSFALYDAITGKFLEGGIVSVSEIFKNSNIKLYPNPSSSNLTIQFPEQNYSTIEIRTVLGELVTSLKFEEGNDSHIIPIENFPISGQYFLHLKGKNPAVVPVTVYR